MIAIIALVSAAVVPLANQTTGQTINGSITVSAPPSATELACSMNWATVNSQMTPNLDAQTGHTDSQLTGKTVTKITFYLCSKRVFSNGVGCINPVSGCCPLPANDTQSVNIGVFNSGTGALVQSYGTVGIQTLTCWCGQGVTCPQTAQAFSFSGSHIMQGNEMLGVTFSNTQDAALVMCEGACTGTENPTGAAVDCTPACLNSNGFGLAGPFTYLGIKNTNVTSSPGLPAGAPLLPLFVAVIPLYLLTQRMQDKGGV